MALAQLREMFGKAFGTRGYDPAAYGQWTRYLVVRPLVLAAPAGGACILVLLAALVLGASDLVAYALALLGLLPGLFVGVWLWSRSETDRKRSANRGYDDSGWSYD